MLGWMRVKIGPVIISLIIGFIAIVFIFSGVFSPKATRGLHSGSVAGLVNGEAISLSEFNRALNQRLEFFQKMAGKKLSEEEMRTYRIKEGVFNELVSRKLMSQESRRMGLGAGDEEVKEKIREMEVFKKDGKFDVGIYKRILAANNYTPSGFERLIREDALLQSVGDFIRSRIRVSEEEIRQEFLISKEKRNIKYVLLTLESGRKGVRVLPDEIKKFLADEKKLNLARSRYEAGKDVAYKGMTFEKVREKIAEEVLASEKSDEIQKINEGLADKVLPLLRIEKSADASVNALLKSYGVEVKSTGLLARTQRYLPGIGDIPPLLADAFDKKAPLDPKTGGKAKKYSPPSGILLAVVTESESPDLSKLEGEREKLRQQLVSRKERDISDGWMKKLHSKAKIEKNKTVLEGAEDYTVEVPYSGS